METWVTEAVYGAEADTNRKTLLSAPEYKITISWSLSIHDPLQEFSRWLIKGAHQKHKQAAYEKNVNNSAFLPALTTMETITTFSLLTHLAAQPYLSCAYRHCTGYRSFPNSLPFQKGHYASHSAPAHQHKDNIESIDHPETLTGGYSSSATDTKTPTRFLLLQPAPKTAKSSLFPAEVLMYANQTEIPWQTCRGSFFWAGPEYPAVCILLPTLRRQKGITRKLQIGSGMNTTTFWIKPDFQ